MWSALHLPGADNNFAGNHDHTNSAKQDLIRRIGEQKNLLDKINRQLDVMP